MKTLKFFACCFLASIFWGCTSSGKIIAETPIIPQRSPPPPPPQAQPVEVSGLSGEIRLLVEAGNKTALQNALALIQEASISETEFGRMMTAIAVVLLKKVYGDIDKTLPRPDPPRTDPYTRILTEAENGNYMRPSSASNDYLELTLPFLALLDEQRGTRFNASLDDLEKARRINPKGIIALFFLGVGYERLGSPEEAAAVYNKALEEDPEFYPASLGLARILQDSGQFQLAIDLLTALKKRYPDNYLVARQLAQSHSIRHEWAEAGAILQDLVKPDLHDSGLLLMQIRALIETGKYLQAQMLIDTYNTENHEDRKSRFLLARLQSEGLKNKNGALTILRSLNKNDPNDFETLLYTAKVLLESTDSAEQKEGRELLAKLLNFAGNKGDTKQAAALPVFDVLDLATADALRRASWEEAQDYQEKILEQRRGQQDLLNSFSIEQGLGNREAALSFAKELREKFPDNEEGNIAYIQALIELGRRSEALALIDKRLSMLGSGSFKSRYYYFRSRLVGADAALSDLRSSIFENPRNVDALKAIFEIYDRQGDEKRAIYYLRQAIALSPKDPALLDYQKRYAGKL
jgi:tetratricopeptide (TPR) repeat protein